MSRKLSCLVLSSLLAVSGLAWGLHDPTRPQDYVPETAVDAGAGEEVETEPSYILQYVLVSDRHRFAVVNGHRVREGDLVGEARVLRIGPGAVRIRTADEVQDLKLGFTDIKTSQGRIVQ